jgi:hypothetical protein
MGLYGNASDIIPSSIFEVGNMWVASGREYMGL